MRERIVRQAKRRGEVIDLRHPSLNLGGFLASCLFSMVGCSPAFATQGDLTDFKPRPLTAGDVSQAGRVIAIDVDLAALGKGVRVPIDAWTDVRAANR